MSNSFWEEESPPAVPGTALPQGKAIGDTSLLLPPHGLKGPYPGCLDNSPSVGRVPGPGVLARTLRPRRSRGETSTKPRAQVWGNHQMELFHISSQIISAHTWIPSMASGAPPLSPPEFSGPPSPHSEEGGCPRAGRTSGAEASPVRKSVADAGSAPQRVAREGARQMAAPDADNR